MNYLICYDVNTNNNSRLIKVANYLEKLAFRIQYSVFLLPNTSKKELEFIIKELEKIISSKDDDLRIYQIKNNGFFLGEGINLDDPFILI